MENEKYSSRVIEVSIVILVICVIAAAATPRFSHARSQGKLTDLVSKLQQVRTQISIYKVQHNNLLPGQETTCGDITEQDFVKAMTTKGPDGFGPYLKTMPANSYVQGSGGDRVTCVNDSEAAVTGNEGTGWWLNAATGQFCASDSSFHAAY